MHPGLVIHAPQQASFFPITFLILRGLVKTNKNLFLSSLPDSNPACHTQPQKCNVAHISKEEKLKSQKMKLIGWGCVEVRKRERS